MQAGFIRKNPKMAGGDWLIFGAGLKIDSKIQTQKSSD
jgi:hypothetical protein